MNDFPTLEIKDIEDLHFGVMPHLVIDFGDDVGQIATNPKFEVPTRDLIQRLRGAEEVLRQIQYAKIAGITDGMELATAQNCERCNVRRLTLTKVSDMWLCGHCCFIEGFQAAKAGEPPWWRDPVKAPNSDRYSVRAEVNEKGDRWGYVVHHPVHGHLIGKKNCISQCGAIDQGRARVELLDMEMRMLSDEDEAMDLVCGDPDCCGWTPREEEA